MTAERSDTQQTIRALAPGDGPEVFALSMRAFEFELPTDPDRLADLRRRWGGKVAHLSRTDPEGGFVAEEAGVIVAAAQALVREEVWGLSLLVVEAERRGQGLGRRLLDLTRAYGRNTPGGLILSSSDPAAIRSYAAAGFTLHPTVGASGQVRRGRLPAVGAGVREGGVQDIGLTGEVSRLVRGGTHEPDLAEALRTGDRLALCGQRGFALYGRGELRLLAARDEDTARALLWTVLAEGGEKVEVGWMTGAQEWAVDVVTRAGLDVHPRGPLFVRGQPGPLAPYLPSGSYL